MTGFLKKYFKIAWQNKLLSFVWLTAIVVACCFCYVRLVQHNIFQTSAFDLGIHASVAWNTAHGRLFYDSLRDINYLADHFSPIYLLLFPIMRLFTPAKALLVLQSASLFLAFPAVYLLGRRFTHSRLVSVGIAFLFLSMPYLHQINNFDFHPVALAVPLLLWLIYFMKTRRWILFSVFLMLCLMLKESMSISIVALGAFIINKKENRVLGLALVVSGVIIFFIVNKYVMPAFCHGWINTHWNRYSHLGPNLEGSVKNILHSPIGILKTLLSDRGRVQTLYSIAIWTGFLCLLSPRSLIALTIVILPHLLSNYPPQISLNHQYSSYILPFMILSICDGIRNGRLLFRRIRVPCILQRRVFMVIISFAIGCMVFSWPGYIRAYNSQTVDAAHKVIREIPKNTSVAASSSFLPHLTNRPEIKLLFQEPPAVIQRMEFIVLDIYDPVPWPVTDVAEWKDYVHWLLVESPFGVYRREGNIILLKHSYRRKLNPRIWQLIDSVFPGDIANTEVEDTDYFLTDDRYNKTAIYFDESIRYPNSNVILISIDTLRADHLGCYGYNRITSPNIDNFAIDSVLFSENIAQAPSTSPSHASIFTSLVPSHHGVFHAMKKSISFKTPVMADILRRNGYATVSYNGGGQIAAEFGFDHGFDTYHSFSEETFDTIANSAIDWMKENQDEKFFLFLHTYETHHPYTPKKEYLKLFEKDCAGDLPRDISIDLLRKINKGKIEITDDDASHIVNAYDAEIYSMDEAFGKLISYLRQEELYDNTVIILTSDHGEEFGEHGTFGWHSHTLYDELLKVPLIIKLPNSIYSSVVIEEQTRSMDILPTLLSILDLPNTRICEGVNLVNWFARQRSKELCAISQQDTLGQAHPTTIRTKKWKLYDEKLFDLESDPLEKRDVRKDNHEIYDRLQGILSRYLNKKVYNNIETKTVNPNNETLMKLRSLGYVE